MLGTRKRDVDPIDTLDVVSGLPELLDWIKMPTLRKPIEAWPSSNEPEFLTREIMTIFASCPWKVSTVPIRIYLFPKNYISTMSSQNSMALPTCLET